MGEIEKQKELKYLNKIKSYIKENIKKGYNKDSIKKRLLSNKLSKEEVDKLFFSAEKELKKEKKIKFIISIGIIISIITFYLANQLLSKPPTPILLTEFPECLMYNDSFERYSCYYNKSINEEGAYFCGYYFIKHKTNVTYIKIIKEGEIILKIDGINTKNLDVFSLGEYITQQKIGNQAILKTNNDTYNYIYLPGEFVPVENGGASLQIEVGKAYCR